MTDEPDQPPSGPWGTDEADLTPAQALERQVEEIKAMSVAEMREQLPVIRQANARIATAIQRGGQSLDPLGVIMKRLESIVLMMEPKAQLQVNFAFETAMNAALVEAEREIRIATLTQGLGPINGRPGTNRRLPPRPPR